MRHLRRIILLAVSICLVTLLLASISAAGETDVPSDRAIIRTLMIGRSSCKAEMSQRVRGKFKQTDGSYKVFLETEEGLPVERVFTLIPLDNGEWMVGCMYVVNGVEFFQGSTILK